MKDPAFLFYGKDFYEGTRTMLPEERACLIDLLVYQHQHGGLIPNNIKRLQMYCSGIDEATLKATLEAKFVLSDKGWHNGKMQVLTEERNAFKETQSINGKVGQFYKKAYKVLSKIEQKKLKARIDKLSLNNEALYNNWITKHQDPKAMLQAMLEHIVIEDGDVIVNEDINDNTVDNGKEGMGEKPNLVYPFDTETFREQWTIWKGYRANEDGFKYKTLTSEQAALSKLGTLSKYDEAAAIAIMHESMANGWKGFFEEKQNGSTKQPSGKGESNYSDAFKRKIVGRVQSG
ncbi:DUF1376 domain-containing protein [Flavobacterium hauense]